MTNMSDRKSFTGGVDANDLALGLQLLDETGEALSSAKFAEQLALWRANNLPAVVFVIGGADGLAPTLRDKAKMATAEWILITGATCGLGSLGVQAAKLLGCKVIAAGAADRVQAAVELGADAGIVYRSHDIEAPIPGHFRCSNRSNVFAGCHTPCLCAGSRSLDV